MQLIIDSIQQQDRFFYHPEEAIIFNGRQWFKTVPGGLQSIWLGVVFTVLWYQNFSQMYFFENN